MQVRLVPLDELAERDVSAWRELASRAVEPNPFFEPEFVLPADRHLGGGPVALLVVADKGDWQVCAPVHRPLRWRRLPLPTLAVWRHLYCFLGTPLVAPDRLEAGLAAFVRRGRREPRTAALALDWLGGEGAVASCLADTAGPHAHAYERFERAGLRRRPQPTYLAETLTGHRRRELQRLRRALARDVGAPVAAIDRAGDRSAASDFVRLEASGWKGRAGTALGSLDGHGEFFRSVCQSFAHLGRLELLELSAAGRPVAMKCNLVAGAWAFCFKIAYDDGLARYSPGLQLECDTVTRFHERPELAVMDSCAAADNRMINRLWPDRRAITTLVVSAEGPLGWAARHGARAAIAVRNRRRSAK